MNAPASAALVVFEVSVGGHGRCASQHYATGPPKFPTENLKISGGEFREKSLGARLPENAAAQISRENYLIPIDAKFQAEEDLAEQGVKLADIVAALEATQTKVRIVVVDACRDNPFGGSAADDTGGFALVDAPEGALIAYSTSPGTAAFDGLGKHSPYAAAFMRTARTPNLPVEQVF